MLQGHWSNWSSQSEDEVPCRWSLGTVRWLKSTVPWSRGTDQTGSFLVAEVYCSLVQRHRPDWVISGLSPDCPTLHRQSPDCPALRRHSPDSLTLHRQWPDSLTLHRQWPDCPTLHTQSPDCSVLHRVCMGQLRRLC